ncbi:MAG: hypothetical protein KA715_14595 [Xanthomonadaceae bacterium]|nr:hypothetical protein [Xanthomonadaceae bacterium]
MKLFSIFITAAVLSPSTTFASPETQHTNKKIFGFLKKWKDNKRIRKENQYGKNPQTPFMQEIEAWDSKNADDPVASKGRCGVLNWQVAYIIIHIDAKGSNHVLIWNNLKSSVFTNPAAKPMKTSEIAKIKLINENPSDAFSDVGEYTNHVMSKDLAVQLMIEAEKRGLCQ